MSDAGLTNGAFYTHFESKEDLFCKRPCRPCWKGVSMQASIDKAGLEGAVGIYLSARHRDTPGKGCADGGTRSRGCTPPEAYTRNFHHQDRRDYRLDGGTVTAQRDGIAAQRRDRVYGMMIGTLQLARAVSDRQFSDEILESGIQAALALIGHNA